eukprot:2539017-Amphidinium_carterae.1
MRLHRRQIGGSLSPKLSAAETRAVRETRRFVRSALGFGPLLTWTVRRQESTVPSRYFGCIYQSKVPGPFQHCHCD